MFFNRKIDLIQEPVLEKSCNLDCAAYTCSSNSCVSNAVGRTDQDELDNIIESPTLRLGG